jgi:hypothetical protein
MRHEWQCSTCEQIFTRKWNCQRHVKDSHAGDGQVVPVSVYPSGGKWRKRNGGKRHRNGGYFYDYRAPAYASGAFAEMGNYYGQGSLAAAAGPYRKNRQTGAAKWDVWWEQARRITENMEKVFKGPSPQAAASAAPRGIPTEIIVGTVCEKCGTVSYLPLPHPYTGSYDVVNLCACNNRDKPVEEEKDSQRRLVNIHENINPEILKQMVDSWLMGYQKYLAAYRLPLERLSALPASGELKWYEIDAAKLKNNGNAKEEEGGERMVNERRPHTNSYIVRAIRSWGKSPGGSVSDDQTIDAAEDDVYGWVPLTENEVFDFLTKARATAMICQVVYSRDGNGNGDGDGHGPEENGHWYYLKIVPRHEIVAREQREQNAMINSMRKEMYTEMMSELKEEEEEEDAIYNHTEPREGDKENHSSGDLREEPTIAAGRDRLQAGPTQERQNKQAKKQEHEQKLQQQRQEERDNSNGLPSRSKEKDEILKISEIRVPQYFEPVLSSNHNSAYPSSDAWYCRYAIQDLVGGPTDKQSWYLGLEIDGGDTRIWGFSGESTQMMHPKSRELQRQLGVGGVNDHPDDESNRQQVCYGIEYPGRTMSSFLFGLPPLEDVELDMKGNGATQDNNSNPFSFPADKGLQILQDNGTCKIESITPDEIIFTINERDEFPWKYLGRTTLFAGRYRLFSPEQDSERVCSTRPIKDGKKLWQLSRVA